MPTASSTFIYIGNFADIDPDETNATNENPNEIFQTFGKSDMSVTTVIQDDANADGQVQENDGGQTPDTFSYDVGSGPVTSGLDNAARYSVDYIDENGNMQSATISAYQTENGDVFLKFPNGIKLQSVTIKSIVGDGYTGITHGTSSNAEVVCFALGTLINTPTGPQAVETLVIGDMVETLDHGAQAIRWIQRSDHPIEDAIDDTKPVFIKAGTFGIGNPSQNLIVSPQHRVLIGENGQLENACPIAAFAPAKALTILPGIRFMKGKSKITWIHFACDRHEIVYANGCLTEALLIGPMVLQGLIPTKRRILIDMYGMRDSTSDALNGPLSRPCLTVGQVRKGFAGCQFRRDQHRAIESKKWDDDAWAERQADHTEETQKGIGNSSRQNAKVA